MNADVCGDFPLQEMLEFHKEKPTGTFCTILGTEVVCSGSKSKTKEM